MSSLSRLAESRAALSKLPDPRHARGLRQTVMTGWVTSIQKGHRRRVGVCSGTHRLQRKAEGFRNVGVCVVGRVGQRLRNTGQ